MKTSVVSRVLFVCLLGCLLSVPSGLIAGSVPVPDVSDVGVNKNAWNVAYSGATGATYYVNTSGNNLNSGTTRSAALKTIQAAIDKGAADYAAGRHVKILIAPGTYREAFNLNYRVSYSTAPGVAEGDDTTPPIATSVILDRDGDGTTGEVHVTGTTVYNDGWTLSAEPGVYWQPWANHWGDSASPWPEVAADLGVSLLQRREGVFADGVMLRQVRKAGAVTFHNLQNGEFLVDEDVGKIYVRADWVTFTGTGSNRVANKPMEITTEVADPLQLSNQDGCVISNVHNIKISNMVFERFPTIWQGGGLAVRFAKNLWIRGCTFTQNSAVGLRVTSANWIQIEMLDASANGSLGMSGSKAHRMWILSNSGFLSNNQRGSWSGFDQWYIAGCKLGTCNKTKLAGVLVDSNLAHGLWFDVGCRNTYVYNCIINNNYIAGGDENNSIFYEISPGPAKFELCAMSGSDFGAFISNSNNAYLYNNDINGCVKGGVVMRNDEVRMAPTGDYCQNFWMQMNRISTNSLNLSHRLVFGKGQDVHYRRCLAEATILNNTYQARSANPKMFEKDISSPSVPRYFSSWQNASNPERDTAASGSTITFIP